MTTVASIAHLPIDKRVAHYRKKAITEGAWTLVFVALSFVCWGQWYLLIPAFGLARSLYVGVTSLAMVRFEKSGQELAEAEDEYNRAHPGNRIGYGKKVTNAADRISADIFTTFRQNNVEPASLVVTLFNLAGARSNSLVAFVSTLGMDGTLATTKIPAGRTQQIFDQFPTPFDAGREWRAVFISARPGKTASVELMDEFQVDDFVTEAGTFDNPEIFRRFHY